MWKVDQVIPTMGGVFYYEEPASHNKRCKFLAGTLKEVFYHCQTFSRRLSTASLEEECSILDDVDEVHEVPSSNPFEKFFTLKSSWVSISKFILEWHDLRILKTSSTILHEIFYLLSCFSSINSELRIISCIWNQTCERLCKIPLVDISTWFWIAWNESKHFNKVNSMLNYEVIWVVLTVLSCTVFSDGCFGSEKPSYGETKAQDKPIERWLFLDMLFSCNKGILCHNGTTTKDGDRWWRKWWKRRVFFR